MSDQPQIGERRTMICAATDQPTLMEYVGEGYESFNGHPGWLCLDEEEEAEEIRAIHQDNRRYFFKCLRQ